MTFLNDSFKSMHCIADLTCRLCRSVLSKKPKRPIFGESFDVSNQLEEIIDCVPYKNDDEGEHVCNQCWNKLNKLNKLDNDMENKFEAFVTERYDIIEKLREKHVAALRVQGGKRMTVTSSPTKFKQHSLNRLIRKIERPLSHPLHETKSCQSDINTSTFELQDSQASTSDFKKEHLYKILVIGELGTGKTSIIKRYVHQFFSQHYRATIGVDFALKVLNWDAETIVRLQLWDIAGQERFGNMTRVYYKEAVGCFIVFDVTRASTMDAVTKWKADLDSKVQLSDGSPVPCVLLANKCDQAKEGLVNNASQMDEFCKEKGFIGWFETSAKENINIDEASRFLVDRILQNDQNLRSDEEKDGDIVNMNGEPGKKPPEKKSGCC